jgi:pimeloyl-ACP methyl ester carboxylesterase
MLPEIRYAKSDGVHIAYQVIGDGPLDLVVVPGWVSNIDCFWEEPSMAQFLKRLGSFARLILFDKRGTGLSDRITSTPTLEERMDDVRAVMEAVGSEKAALLGYSEGGPMCALFAASYPRRTHSLIMIGAYARRLQAPGYTCGHSRKENEAFIEMIRSGWGGPVGLETRAPDLMADAAFKNWWARLLRNGSSPSAAVALARMNAEIDVRHVLTTIQVPTLVLHRTGDRAIPVACGRSMAEQIPGAKFIELPGNDHLPWAGNADEILDEVQAFLTGVRQGPQPDRVLLTVMFVDMVDSTRHAAAMGDQRWHSLLARYHAMIRNELAFYKGREVDNAGDGFLATFDGPARAIRSACAIRGAVAELGISVRVGLHTGECELQGEKPEGIAVHIGARVASIAGADEVLVSSTVKDLVAGSGLQFDDQGLHELKGVPGRWHLFRVKQQ